MSRSMVYKLHFWPPYKHAAHYSGRSDKVPERLMDHHLGRGARLTQVQVRAGGSWVIGLLEPGGAKRERQIKGHDASRYCDVCHALEGYQAGELSQPEALARAGWARATPHERGLLLDMFGIEQTPERIPEQTPEIRPIRRAPEPQVVRGHPRARRGGCRTGGRLAPRSSSGTRTGDRTGPRMPAPRLAPEPQVRPELELELEAGCPTRGAGTRRAEPTRRLPDREGWRSTAGDRRALAPSGLDPDS